MYKIYKTAITGFDIPGWPAEVIGINANYRKTMGYDDATKTITVSVDKIIKPDLTRDEKATVTYESVATRSFTPADFVQFTDNMAWIVEFDVASEKISDPFDILAYTKTKIDGSNTHQDITKLIKARHSDKLFPCFQIDSFYKKAADFSASILTFFMDDSKSDHDTVITASTPAQTEILSVDRIKDIQMNYVTNIVYQILDADGNVVESEIPTSPFGNAFDAGEIYAKTRGNQFVISLPAANQYKIRVNYMTGYPDKTISAQYDVNCINGVSSKDRLNSGKRTGQTNDFSYIGPSLLNENFAGYEDVIIDNKLQAGDYIKFKLDCGDAITYSELMINLV